MASYYVDPNAGSDTTGDGSSGNPWQTVQKALNTIVQGATGDQINVKAGTADVLSAALTLATYGTPSVTKPLVIRGYTTAQNDGGIGDISGNASVAILNETKSFIYLKDMHVHNCGAADIWKSTGNPLFVEHCEVDTSTGQAVNISNGAITNSYIHDGGGTSMAGSGNILFCRLAIGSKTPSRALAGTVNAFNTVSVGSTSNGIHVGNGTVVFRNSIWSNGGTGTGINVTHGNSIVFDNIIEGFSGAGGKGIADGGNNCSLYGNNCFFNNTANTSFTGSQLISVGADVTPGSSSFTNASSGDFSLSAAGITANKAAAYPGAYYGTPFTSYGDRGAVQHQDSGSGGGLPVYIRKAAPVMRM